MTHYEILGIRKTASTDEIKDAYKKLVKKYHPDVYVGDKTFAEKKIKEINEAYDVLSNPEQKKEYDELINPRPTTTYNPKEYSSYTYSAPNYNYNNSNYSYKTSKRNAQARDSKYSYENYKKTYNSSNYGSYDFQKRYTNYHRSKTPNSTYAPNNTVNNYTEKIVDTFFNFSNASKTGVLALIVFLFIIFFIVNIIQITSFLGGSNNISSSSSSTDDSKITYGFYDYYEPSSPTNTTIEEEHVNPYLESEEEEIPTYEDGTIPPLEHFDINEYFTDKELMDAYLAYGTTNYSTFEEFKAAVTEAFYKTYILYY